MMPGYERVYTHTYLLFLVEKLYIQVIIGKKVSEKKFISSRDGPIKRTETRQA